MLPESGNEFSFLCSITYNYNVIRKIMQNYFECKIRYEKTMENGIEKKITEPYIVDAISFTEAEARLIEEVAPFISGEYIVTDIKRAKIDEIVDSDRDADDKYYKCKLLFVTLDEKSGKEKKTATVMLVNASDLRQAVKYLDQHMKGSMADYELASVVETSIIDVFMYKK